MIKYAAVAEAVASAQKVMMAKVFRLLFPGIFSFGSSVFALLSLLFSFSSSFCSEFSASSSFSLSSEEFSSAGSSSLLSSHESSESNQSSLESDFLRLDFCFFAFLVFSFLAFAGLAPRLIWTMYSLLRPLTAGFETFIFMSVGWPAAQRLRRLTLTFRPLFKGEASK